MVCMRSNGMKKFKSGNLSDDSLMGGRISYRQPFAGERVTIDPILLAASVPASGGERVLDAGTGAAAAALCLAYRVSGCRVVGLEKDQQLSALANENVKANQLNYRIRIVSGDIMEPPSTLEPETYHYVIANPPHLRADQVRPSPHLGRRQARIESSVALSDWVHFGLTMLRRGGFLIFIHRVDRLDDLLSCLAQNAGGIVIFPIWPKHNKPAKRVIVQARKNSAAPLRLSTGLVLHESTGKYTAKARAILWDGDALQI